MRITPTAMRWLLIGGFFVAWELLPRILEISPILISPLSTVVQAGLQHLDVFARHFLVTLKEVSIAIAISCVLGVSIGTVVGANRLLSQTVLPLVSSIYAIPIIILYPLFTVWLGIGAPSKVAFGSFYGVLSTILATASGVATIPRQFRVLAYSMGLNPLQETVRVLIPAAIPTVLNSLRLGGGLAIVGVVVAEMLISTAGLGYLITYYRTLMETPMVFFAILLVIGLVVAFDTVMRRLEHSVRHWMPSKHDGAAELSTAVR